MEQAQSWLTRIYGLWSNDGIYRSLVERFDLVTVCLIKESLFAGQRMVLQWGSLCRNEDMSTGLINRKVYWPSFVVGDDDNILIT